MAKFEIKKETKSDGDIYFKAFGEDGYYVACCLKSPTETDEITIAKLEARLRDIVQPKVELVKTIEL